MAPCGKLLWMALLLGFGGCLAAQPATPIDQAFDRLYNFDDLEAVENTLHRLEDIGFVKKLPRQTGYKEQRWAQLLAGDVEVAEEAAPTADRGPSDRERIAALEREVADLKRAFEEFRRSFE